MRLIDADALFTDLDGMMAVSPTGYIHGDMVADMIGDQPTVDAEPVRHGKWIDGMVLDMPVEVCDQCNTFYPLKFTGGGMRYCPNCGAKMDGEGTEE